MLLVAVSAELRWPAKLHTLAWFPPGIAAELRRRDAGQFSVPFGFHAFRSDLPIRDGCYPVNAFIPLPAGQRELATDRRAAVTEHVRGTLVRRLPGFDRAVRHLELLSPADFERILQLRSAPWPTIPPTGYTKPPSYDPDRGIHYLGTSVQPPGTHAGAAALSGRLAAQQVLRQLASRG